MLYLSVVRIGATQKKTDQALNFPKKISSFLPIIFGTLTFLARFPAQGGEDIGNARKNIYSQNPTDFWGGVSSIVYGHFPTFAFINWETLLIACQIAVGTFSISILMRRSKLQSTKAIIWQLLLAYISILFCSQGTRDGLQFTLLLAGFTIGLQSIILNNQIVKKIICLTMIIAGISLRPWLGIALVPLVIYMLRMWSIANHNKISLKKVIAVTILVAITPLGIEIGASRAQDLTPSYPQQQVMIMDSAATYCWGINEASAERALASLKLFTSDPEIGQKICQFFRADTWLSLTKSSQPSNSRLSTDFWLIKAGDEVKYHQLQSLWIQNIVKDPITYIQNKSFFFIKLAIASEMRNIHLLNSDNWFSFIQNMYISIYDLVLATHLLSLLFVWIGIYGYSVRRKNQNPQRDLNLILIVAYSVLWGVLSSIAYIGSNGRYTYTASLLVLILLTFKGKIIKDQQ